MGQRRTERRTARRVPKTRFTLVFVIVAAAGQDGPAIGAEGDGPDRMTVAQRLATDEL